MRRLGLVANLLTRNQVATLVASVSPYKGAREENRRLIGRYLEVYVDCPTEKLIQRDSTGKYKKALAGEIPNFIGITEPYEPPSSPEVTIHSDVETVESGALRIFQALLDMGHVTGEELKVITGKRMKASPPARKGARARPVARAAAGRQAAEGRQGQALTAGRGGSHADLHAVGRAGPDERAEARPPPRGAAGSRLGAGGLLGRRRLHLRAAHRPSTSSATAPWR